MLGFSSSNSAAPPRPATCQLTRSSTVRMWLAMASFMVSTVSEDADTDGAEEAFAVMALERGAISGNTSGVNTFESAPAWGTRRRFTQAALLTRKWSG